MKKILLPVDGSEFSKKAAEKAKELASTFGSEIILLHVNEFFRYAHNISGDGALVRKIREDFDKKDETILKSAQKFFSDTDIKVETVSIEGDAAEEIVKYVDSNDIDLVIMGSHGIGGFRRYLIGSVTHKVLIQIERPILIVR